MIKVKRIKETALLPTRGSAQAAGFDLYAAETITIPASRANEDGSVEIGRAAAPTGLIIEIPEGYYGRVSPRSGLARRNGIDVLAGVIDSDYRNEIIVLLSNLSSLPLIIEQGTRCAQIIFESIGVFDLVETDDLSSTERNTGGFGSTGLR